MHKKGQLGEQLMIFAFIFLIVLIGAGIVIGTGIFIGSEFDFRGSDAEMLSFRVKDCLINSGGEWISGLKSEGGADLLYQKCNLGKSVIESYNRIKVCRGESSPSNCIGEADSAKIVFSSKGDFEPCGLKESNKFLGCSIISTGEYTIIATSNQQIRRNAK